ncbi:diguanylate cyclase [Gemmatirosa kalamazoonensis]|uniref:Diguanylate cyclase n=1 Tax=Gemmatirosa kalamazoonensis TaxID=861299 RepID=W0RLE6_9BACT|nr:diguanylate cyclase [Gemmatirosa kalamazoonensis]AHG90238.1 diguanylate cyclase [Gemmatirosa kalamazoonensis]
MASPPLRKPRPAHLQLVGEVPVESLQELIERGHAAEREGQRTEARACYERALVHARETRDEPRVTALLRWVARTWSAEGRFDEANRALDEALAVAERIADDGAAGHAVNGKAALYSAQGELDEAERLYLRARSLALQAGDSKLAALTAQNLGVIACVRGELEEARRHYELCLAEYRTLGLARDVCVALTNLGKLHTAQSAWDVAEKYFDEALHICDALGEVAVRAQLDVNLAELAVARCDWGRAQATLDHAIEAAQLAGDAGSLGEAHKLAGVVARETGQLAAAERHFVEAERVAESHVDAVLLAETTHERAAMYRRQGRSREALQYLNRAHKLFTQLRARRHLADIDGRLDELESEFETVARRWSESIEAKDEYTQGHCVRVADLACLIAARAGFGARDLVWFRIGALLHDVGKLVIPSDVLNKAGRLTEEEWALMRRHPEAGVEMLAGIDFPWDVRPMIESHHERWDGTGYPRAAAGEAIPLTARMLAIADVYDALTTHRSYKPALSHDAAVELMRRDIGYAFDPALFSLFEEIVRHGPPVPGQSPRVEPRLTGRRPRRGIEEDAPAFAPQPPGAHRPTGGHAAVETDALDDLTGLPLRKAFGDTAARLLDAAGRASAPSALLVIDVDYFKLVNDSFGHLQGDDVLRTVADALREGVRVGDVVGRYAGDEFVVLLPECDPETAHTVAERLRRSVELRRCPRRDEPGESVGVTLSIGLSFAPTHGDSFESLFAAADSALYGAKRRGRNAVTPAAGAGAREAELQIERFAGRREERQRVERLFTTSAAGDPRVLAVVGEAGVGKSTLVRQLGPSARVRSGALVGAACLEADVRPPYGPWADVIAALHALGAVAPRAWRELPRLVPALRHPAAPLQTAEGSRYALLEEISDYLRAASAERPLVLVLDDMQWADGPTWDALEFVVSRLESERLLICLTVRVEDLRGEGADRRRRLSRQPRYEELALRRLSREEVAQWLDVVFEGKLVGDDLLAHLADTAEGNPLFTSQMLRTLLEEDAVRRVGDRWQFESRTATAIPVAVEDLLTRRLDRLSDDARRILTVAAVIGREFDAEVLVEATEGTEDAVLDALDAGMEAAVLKQAGTHDGTRYGFAHALLVDALRRGVNPLRLRRTHERVARVLADRNPDAVSEIALHYDRAGCAEPAFHAAMAAGARAAAVYAHEQAAVFFELAAKHAPAPADAAAAEWEQARLADSRARYAEVETRCARLATELVEGAADAGLLRPARRLRENARLLRGDDAAGVRGRAETLLADAESAGDEVETVELLGLLSQSYSRVGDAEAAERVAAEGVRVAESLGKQRLLAQLVMRLGTAQITHRPSDAVRHFRRALEIYAALDDVRGQLRCHINTGVANDRAENQPAAETSYAAALELARRVKAPDMAGGASLNLGVLLMKTGRYERAAACFDEALRHFTAIENEPLRLAAIYNQANLSRERGDTVAAVPLYERAASLAAAMGQLDVHAGALSGLALTQLELGARASAEARCGEVAALLASRDGWWFQGAELYEALQVRLTAEREPEAAFARLSKAVERAAALDGYAAAWLLATCARPLVAAGPAMRAALEPLAQRHLVRVRARGYAPLLERFAGAELLTVSAAE